MSDPASSALTARIEELERENAELRELLRWCRDGIRRYGMARFGSKRSVSTWRRIKELLADTSEER